MTGGLFQGDNEGAICGGDLSRVVPLDIFRCAVPNIHTLPEGVISGIECPSVGVKLIREDQFIFLSIETSPGLGLVRCLRIDQLREVGAVRRKKRPKMSASDKCQAKVGRKGRLHNSSLARRIDTNDVATSEVDLIVFEVGYDGIAGKEGNQCTDDNKDERQVEHTPPIHRTHSVIHLAWIWIMQCIIFVGRKRIGGIIDVWRVGIGEETALDWRVGVWEIHARVF